MSKKKEYIELEKINWSGIILSVCVLSIVSLIILALCLALFVAINEVGNANPSYGILILIGLSILCGVLCTIKISSEFRYKKKILVKGDSK